MVKFVKKKFNTNDGFRSEDLVQSAVDHLASARLLFERNPRCYDSAGYLAHLGLELMLKSILLKQNEEFPSGHDLEVLYKRVVKLEANRLGKNEEETLKEVNRFFNLRYTNPETPVEIGDDDWKRIEKLSYNFLGFFPADILSSLNKSDHYEKGGRKLFFKLKS